MDENVSLSYTYHRDTVQNAEHKTAMSDLTTHPDYLTITTKTRYEIRDITEHVERVRCAAERKHVVRQLGVSGKRRGRIRQRLLG